MWLPDFTRRVLDAELMDDPACDERLLLRTIEQFATINRLVSRYRSSLTRTVLRDMAREPEREYHLLDLGAGGCDIPVWMLGEARRRGLRLRVTALDSDARVADWACARHAGVPGLSVVCARADGLARFGPVDYVFANHFLHHLPDAAVRAVLVETARVARRGYVFSDLRRGWPGYVGASLLLGLCFRGSFACPDGRLSVRRAFRPAELLALAPAGPVPPRLVQMLPSRLVLLGGAAFGVPAGKSV